MTDDPDERLESEPNFDDIVARLPVTDQRGNVIHELDVERWEPYAHLATACGGLEHVTRLHVENAGLSWQEFNFFVAELLRDQERRLWIMRQEAPSFGADPDAITEGWRKDRLGFLHPPEQRSSDDPDPESRPRTALREQLGVGLNSFVFAPLLGLVILLDLY